MTTGCVSPIISDEITFVYEDGEGKPRASTRDVSVTVCRLSEMELGPINFPAFMNVGDLHLLSFFIRNTGFVPLRNLKVTTEGEGFDHASGMYIVGNFAMGEVDFYDGIILAAEPGEHTLQLVVSYDLDTGEHVRIVEKATVTVTDGSEM